MVGFVAIGSNKGEIRFFNKIDKKAKTLLPGLGGKLLWQYNYLIYRWYILAKFC